MRDGVVGQIPVVYRQRLDDRRLSSSNRLTGQPRQQQTCAPAPRPPGRRAGPTWSTRRTYLVDASAHLVDARTLPGRRVTATWSTRHGHLVDAPHPRAEERSQLGCELVRVWRGGYCKQVNAAAVKKY